VQPQEDGSLVLEFDQPDGIRAFFDAASSQGGFVLTLPRELKMFQTARLRVQLGAQDLRFGFEAEVIQLFPAGPGAVGTAFQLAGWTEKQRQELDRRLQLAGRTADSGAGPGADVPTIFAIRDLNVTEKIRLATKASRTERQILLQDTSPQVLLALLANPRIEDEEILQLVKSIHVSTAVLQQIASNQRWSALYEVQRALVLSPRTPTPLVLKLLELLRTQDLGALAKSGRVREPIKKAALRLYLKRTQSR
jgi:hypothetical protein